MGITTTTTKGFSHARWTEPGAVNPESSAIRGPEGKGIFQGISRENLQLQQEGPEAQEEGKALVIGWLIGVLLLIILILVILRLI